MSEIATHVEPTPAAPEPLHRRAITVVIDVRDMPLPDVAEAIKRIDALAIGETMKAELGSWWG